MSFSHHFGGQARQHLIGRVRGRDEQPNFRRISLPLLDTFAGGLDAQLCGRAGRIQRLSR